jgi:hypothetical protein
MVLERSGKIITGWRAAVVWFTESVIKWTALMIAAGLPFWLFG